MANNRPTKAEQKSQARQAKIEAQRAAQAKAARQQKLRVAAVIGTVIAILAAVAAFAFLGGSGSGGNKTTAADGTAYTADREGFVLPGLLDPAKTVKLADHKGRPVVVNFFASWCVYCNEELPSFVQVAKATAGKVDFIGVDSSDPGDGKEMAKRFDLAGAGFALAEDIGTAPPSDLWRSYGSQGLPVTAFYDKNGKLVDFSGGMLTQAELQTRIKNNFGIDVAAPDAATLGAPVIPLIPRGAYELLSRNIGPEYAPLDIRPADEFATGHIDQAINIPFTAGQFAGDLGKLNKNGSYFVYDGDGKNSMAAADALHSAGFKHVYEIQGGLDAWSKEQFPVTK